MQWSSRTQESLLFCFPPEIRKTQDKKNLNRFEDTFASVTQVVQRFEDFPLQVWERDISVAAVCIQTTGIKYLPVNPRCWLFILVNFMC